jgi:YidC/Oxa1 family membrane protein insertase
MNKRVLRPMVWSLAMAGLVLFHGAPSAAQKPAESVKAEPAKTAAEAKPTATATKPAEAKPATAAKPADAKAADAKAADAKAAEAKPAEVKPADVPPPVAKVETATLEEPDRYRATFTNVGAAPEHWVLLNPQYKEDNPRKSNKSSEPIDLVRTSSPYLPAQTGFRGWDKQPKNVFSMEESAVWKLQPRQGDGDPVVFVYESPQARVTKRFERVPGTYQVRLTVTLENQTGEVLEYFPRLSVYGWQDPNKQGSSGFLGFGRRNFQTEAICFVNDKLHKSNYEELLKKQQPPQEGTVGWAGIGEHYFVMLAAMKDKTFKDTCEILQIDQFPSSWKGNLQATVNGQYSVVAHGHNDHEWTLFFGPKILQQLDAVRVGNVDPKLGRVMDYGLGGLAEIFARPMLAVLKAVHFVVPNWGIAIIVLTILVKAITWWPTQRSMKSMKAMGKLKPEMDKLKERFGDDKNAMNLAMMELYKKHGVNPLGGCLPILLQMPIYIALYSMLGASVELYRGTFLWIKDLTAPDPYYVLPVLTGALMFLQQKTQPAASVDPQQKNLMYAMPLIFTALNIFWPAGLTIYILTNTILTFLQQWWNNRNDQPSKPAASAKPARA